MRPDTTALLVGLASFFTTGILSLAFPEAMRRFCRWYYRMFPFLPDADLVDKPDFVFVARALGVLCMLACALIIWPLARCEAIHGL